MTSFSSVHKHMYARTSCKRMQCSPYETAVREVTNTSTISKNIWVHAEGSCELLPRRLKDVSCIRNIPGDQEWTRQAHGQSAPVAAEQHLWSAAGWLLQRLRDGTPPLQSHSPIQTWVVSFMGRQVRQRLIPDCICSLNVSNRKAQAHPDAPQIYTRSATRPAEMQSPESIVDGAQKESGC